MRECGRYNYRAQFEPGFDTLLKDLGAMLLDGHYVLSSHVSDFERRFATFNGSAHCLGVNTGTDALLIALRGLGIGAGDEIITQANTFHATVAAIELSGATPVLVDADEETFLIDVPASGPRSRREPAASSPCTCSASRHR